jgi:hypothetical protein
VHWHVVGRADLTRYEDDHAPAVVKPNPGEVYGQLPVPG